MLTCEHCNCELSNTYSLNRHKTTNLKCLTIQGVNIDDLDSYMCVTCDKVFINKNELTRHNKTDKTCILISNHSKEIDDLKTNYSKEIEELKMIQTEKQEEIDKQNEKIQELKDYIKTLDNIHQNIAQSKIKMKNYESIVFDRTVDYCPIEYYCNDIVYFIKFSIPKHLHSEYVLKYPVIEDEKYSCIEFGVTSDIEERLKSHRRDKKKENMIFLHAIDLDKRYTASKMESYIKRVAIQLNASFQYEKRKECVILDEEKFNILVDEIKDGRNNLS